MTKLLLHFEKNSFSLAEFSKEKNGEWKLQREASCTSSLEAAESDFQKKGLHYLQQTLRAWKIKDAELFCLLPAKNVFLQTITIEIPSGLEEAIPRLIEIEAKRVFAVPLDELVWNFKILTAPKKESIRVVLVATKKIFLAPFLEIISKTNLRIKAIYPVSCALQAAWQLTDQSSEGCLFIDATQSVFNVMLMEPDKIFSSYTFAPLQLETKEFSPAVSKKISTDIQNILEQARAQEVISKNTFLSGAPCLKSQLAFLFQENFNTPTKDADQLFNNDHAPYTEKTSTSSRHEEFFSPTLVAGSMALFQNKHLEFNLLPDSLRLQQHLHQQRPYFYAGIALLIGTLLLWAFYFNHEAQCLIAAAAEKRHFLKQEQKKLQESDQAVADFIKIQKQEEAFANLLKARAAWPMLIEELQRALPSRYVWITKLSATPKEKNCSVQKNKKISTTKSNFYLAEEAPDFSINAIILEGLYLENPRQAAVVDDFIEELKKSKLFVIKNKEAVALLCSPADGTAYAYSFKLLLPLQN